MYKSKFSMWEMILRRFLMIKFEVFLRYHLSNTRSIALLGSFRGIFGGLGGEL